jgi:CBS domain containing-hemolysin-like protein
MNYILASVLVLLCGMLALVSYVDRIYTEVGKFISREFQENIEIFEQQIEPRIGMSRTRVAISMAVLIQLTTAAISLLVAFFVFNGRVWNGEEILEAALGLIFIIVLFNRFLPFVFFSRTRGQWLAHWIPVLRFFVYIILPVTLSLGFLRSVASLTKEHSEEQPDSQSEAVDALIEAGQEEGIVDESNRALIQSVVEFGGKTVREAMTPRPEMFAVPADTTVEKFIEMLRAKPFTRVPVYEGAIHKIKGIVSTQDVLQVADSEAQTRTVGTLMRTDVCFVPESKLGSDLLREMQRNNLRMALVVDEYGGIAGLVTMEDLLEEIVGEIGDEHEKAQVVRETDHSYLVPGNMDVDRLDELFGFRPEGMTSATIAGLVSELAGRIPHSGEVVEEDGFRFEVLQSTERRVERVRVSTAQPKSARLV